MRRWLLLPAIVAAGFACSEATAPPNASPTSILLQSDPDDFVGQGKTYEYSLANAIIQVSARVDTFAIYIRGDDEWTGRFTIPNSHARLEPGLYLRATRFLYNNPREPGMSFFGTYGCDQLTGEFRIGGLTFVDATLTAIDLTFEQHCEDPLGHYSPAALRGRIHWRADDPTRPPGPVNPIPTNLWQPPVGGLPIGNYVYLESSGSDFIGQGRNYTYTPANATVTLNTGPAALAVGVGASNGLEWWSGSFRAMNSINALEVGYYPGLRRFVNPTKGGLDWSGSGRGCNTLTGWFAIDSLTYAADSLTAVTLRFEQHCDGSPAALHGAVHWTR